jgi:TonB family protein
MIANSEQWVGQVIDGKFRLERTLGGSDRSAVFLAEQTADRRQCVIRLLDANASGARDQLQRWEAAAKLSHPNLMRIFETGRCQISGHDYSYVVSEYAEENLAQIIPERALSAEETRQVLQDVLTALAYIHGQDLVHGDLKPSNIFAVGETVKISSDALFPAGQPLSGRTATPPYDAPEASVATLEPPADTWSLGVLLVEALTQHKPVVDWPREKPSLPATMPQPFREIAENCLHVDPAERWTVARIASQLRGEKSVTSSKPATPPPTSSAAAQASSATPKTQTAKWPYAIAAVVVIALIALLIPRSKPPVPEATTQQTSGPRPAPSQPATMPSTSTPASRASPSGQADGQIAERLVPRVSPGALHTIHGKIRVVVELKVDEKGKVTQAKLKSSGSSQYFAEKALDAAKGWKFKPPVENSQPVASEWRVRFTFSRGAIDDSAEQVNP